MTPEQPLAADDAFFQALVKADASLLEDILAGDFLIVDIMRGDVNGRADFIAAVAAQQVTFHEIEPADRQVRFYGTTAVIVGRTRMSGSSAEGDFTFASRYTHVFTLEGDGWKLASAQGTPIAG